MSLLALDEVSGKQFDRVTYSPSCHGKGKGIIVAVWVSLTKIVLEGRCAECSQQSIHSIDLLEVDAWLTGEVDNP